MMKLPNFVVIGAPKCGTTSLYYYLKQHPDIYLPKRKELHYFSYEYLKSQMAGPGDELILSSICATRQEYKKFYKDVECQTAIGEVSPSYFYFSDVSKRIRDELGRPKIILLLRNPIEKAYSQYMHLIRDNWETLGFYDALMAEEQRIKDGYSDFWRYAESSLYSERVKTYISIFGKSHMKIILFEDLLRQPDVVMRDLFIYLGVDPDFRSKTSKIYHRSGSPKSKFVADFLAKPNIVAMIARKLVPEKIRTPIRLALLDINTGKKDPIGDRSLVFLQEYFKNDLKELEQLLGKKLDWLSA